MKCIICDKKIISTSVRKKDKKRVTCSRNCARVYRRVRYYLYRKIKTKFEKEIIKKLKESYA